MSDPQLRVMRNRGVNTAHTGLSAQPIFGGPAYYIRNVVYNTPVALKFANPAGVIAGWYFDANTVSHGFLRARDGTIATFNSPSAGTSPGQGTFLFTINPAPISDDLPLPELPMTTSTRYRCRASRSSLVSRSRPKNSHASSGSNDCKLRNGL